MTRQPPVDRRVADLNAAELLEAAVGRLAGLGVGSGRWHLELEVDAGRVRRLSMRPSPAIGRGATLGREQLSRERHKFDVI